MKDVSFGQYYPVSSFLHRMDARLKILFMIAYIVAIFLASNFYGLAVCTFVLIVATIASRVPLGKVLRSLRGILFLVIFTAALNLFFYGGDQAYWPGRVQMVDLPHYAGRDRVFALSRVALDPLGALLFAIDVYDDPRRSYRRH